jgi:hypothetical protein
MWSLARSILAASLAASAVTAQLSFVASVQQDGQEADASALGFKQIPPLSHGRHAARPRSGHGHGGHRATGRDAISYSSNWCGASQHTNRQDSISSVYGYFTVPELTLRPGIPAPQFAAAWVGIDGAECNSTLLQAGVTTVVRAKPRCFSLWKTPRDRGLKLWTGQLQRRPERLGVVGMVPGGGLHHPRVAGEARRLDGGQHHGDECDERYRVSVVNRRGATVACRPTLTWLPGSSPTRNGAIR